MKVGEAAIRLLEAYGVRHVFGIPGVHNLELYRALADCSTIEAVTARHEQGAAFMADAYARVTGRPGVCLPITGPGLTNAMTPIAQAWHDSIPLFVLASTTDTTALYRQQGTLHDVPDQAALTETITNMSTTLQHPNDLPKVFHDAWMSMVSDHPRPVQVAIPVDLLEQECESFAELPLSLSKLSPPTGALDGATNLLAEAERPVIVAGGGAVDAGTELVEFATAVDAPIVLTGNAKGVVPGSHPLCVGARLPVEPVLSMVEHADVIVAVGTELSEVQLHVGRPLAVSGALIRIDVDALQLHNPLPATAPIRGDVALVLAELTAGLESWKPLAEDRASGVVSETLANLEWSREIRNQQPWLDAVADSVPQNAIWSLDSTQLAYSLHHYVDLDQPRSWLAPYGLGTLGPAIPMAVGAKVAEPERPAIAVVGDGGILFTISELATAVDLGRQLTVILWDNRGYGEIRDSMDRVDIPHIGTETTAHDLAEISRGFGCKAVNIETPEQLKSAIEESIGYKGTTVIVARVTGT